jgi:hypothetical protein
MPYKIYSGGSLPWGAASAASLTRNKYRESGGDLHPHPLLGADTPVIRGGPHPALSRNREREKIRSEDYYRWLAIHMVQRELLFQGRRYYLCQNNASHPIVPIARMSGCSIGAIGAH